MDKNKIEEKKSECNCCPCKECPCQECWRIWIIEKDPITPEEAKKFIGGN
jgi:hypothetical protein